MLREFESPAYVRIVFYLGVAITGMAIVVGTLGEPITVRDQLLRLLQIF